MEKTIIKKVPKPHQLEHFKFWEKTKKYLNCDDTGNGKTFTCVNFIKEKKITDLVIICPLAVVGQWRLELEEQAGIKVNILKGRTVPYSVEPGAYIVHYDVLHNWFSCLNRDHQAVIIDESQLIGNPKAKRTKAAIALTKKASYVACLSATPFKTYPKQLWSVLHIIQPEKWKSAWAFYSRYCGLKKGIFGIEYNGATNMNELRERMKPIMLGFKNNQNFQRIDIWHDCNIIAIPLENAVNELAALNGAQLRARMATMQMVNFEKKIAPVLDWLKMQTEKVIVFYWHHVVGDSLKLYLDCPLFDGRTSGEERARLLANPPDILAMNIQSGGVGIDGLQNHYSTVAFVEFGYSPADIKQAIGRVARTGQKKPVRIYFHGALNTTDEIFMGRIESRFGLLKSMFNTISDSFITTKQNLFSDKEG